MTRRFSSDALPLLAGATDIVSDAVKRRACRTCAPETG